MMIKAPSCSEKKCFECLSNRFDPFVQLVLLQGLGTVKKIFCSITVILSVFSVVLEVFDRYPYAHERRENEGSESTVHKDKTTRMSHSNIDS